MCPCCSSARAARTRTSCAGSPSVPTTTSSSRRLRRRSSRASRPCCGAATTAARARRRSGAWRSTSPRTRSGSDRLVALTAREFELLALFAGHPRQVLTREQIFERVWGSWGDRSAVAVYVRRLREKLEDVSAEVLVTVWGVGYRFDPPGR